MFLSTTRRVCLSLNCPQAVTCLNTLFLPSVTVLDTLFLSYILRVSTVFLSVTISSDPSKPCPLPLRLVSGYCVFLNGLPAVTWLLNPFLSYVLSVAVVHFSMDCLQEPAGYWSYFTSSEWLLCVCQWNACSNLTSSRSFHHTSCEWLICAFFFTPTDSLQ